MRVHHIFFALATVSLIGGGIYLWRSVSSEPDKAATVVDNKRGTAVRHRPDTPETMARKAKERGKREFVRKSTSPDLMPDGSERPKPFQARSEPAKNHALFVGVKTDEMALRVDNVNQAYFRREFGKVVSEATELLEELPENQQLRRLLIRAACNDGKPDIARKHLPLLSESDQGYLREHCRTYGLPVD